MIYIGILIVVVVQGQPPPPDDPGEVAPQGERFEPDGSNGSASGYVAKCQKCGWMNFYPTTTRAKQALGGHSRFCKGKNYRVSPFAMRIKNHS